ncbi:MAG: FAD-dependent oxidoreductase [Chloroflexi bacterium]|nr:FAD-dependent oxidoreductase [Chloroflexota bacterium]
MTAIRAEPASAEGKWPFETPPPPIPQADIKKTLVADIIVVGAGLSGMCAALSAVQAGATVIVIEKGPRCTFHGGWNGVVGSRLQKKLGLEFDKAEVVAELMRWSAYQADQRLLRLWADESGPAMDWLLDMADGAGIPVEIEADLKQDDFYKHYPTSHLFPRPQGTMAPRNATLLHLLESHARAAGVTIHFETPAVQLLKEERGRVAGVIARTADGYVQLDARAIVLCTGGYEHDPEMLKRYVPRALNVTVNSYLPPLTTGDGHKMALWIGAVMDDAGHCPLLFDGGMPGTIIPLALARQPFLNVNLAGERYMNEDAPYGYIANADLLQPGHVKWTVWDGKAEADAARFHSTYCKRMVPPLHSPEIVRWAIEKGYVLQADTLEELGQKMVLPEETFLATVRRYNELARLGQDLDFGKPSSRLSTIELPPFFAAKTGAALLGTLTGLKVNTRLQVLDTAGAVIPGLYAAGNASGGFFANDYPITMAGISHGRALTFGRLAGLNAATER